MFQSINFGSPLSHPAGHLLTRNICSSSSILKKQFHTGMNSAAPVCQVPLGRLSESTTPGEAGWPLHMPPRHSAWHDRGSDGDIMSWLALLQLPYSFILLRNASQNKICILMRIPASNAFIRQELHWVKYWEKARPHSGTSGNWDWVNILQAWIMLQKQSCANINQRLNVFPDCI